MPAKPVPKIQIDAEEAKLNKKLMEEQELRRLMREERLRRDGGDKTTLTAKPQPWVDALMKERENLMSDLRVMQTERVCLTDHKQAEGVAHLFGQGDNLDMDIAREKRYIADLEAQIRKESVQLDRHRKSVKSFTLVSDQQLQEQNQRVDRAAHSWKSRLHAEQVELSVIMKDNALLRKRLDLLLKSKAQFNQLFEELVRKLNKGKKILADIVDQTKAQYKKKDEVARKIQALTERDAADQAKRQDEIQNYEMRLYEDLKLSKFKEQVMQARTKLSESAKATKKMTLLRGVQEQLLQGLMDTWETLKQQTGLDSCQEVCDLVERQEADNFSLFNYNNDLRYQLEVLTDATAELLKKVDEEQEAAFQWEDDQERSKNELTIQLDSVESTVNVLTDHHDSSCRMFDRLLSKIRALFELTRGDPRPLDLLLGDNRDVTQFNYRLYLGLVEANIVELLGRLPRGPDPAQQLAALSATPSVSPGILADRKVVTRPCHECDEAAHHKRTNVHT